MQGVLKRHKFNYKKQYGQNFISDANLLRSIVSLADVEGSTSVVEIGCGAGTLTRELSLAAKRVIAYEIDGTLRPVLEETLRGCENTEVIFRDFEKANLPELEKELGEYVVVANLPYYITTPLVMRFLEEAKSVLRIVIMVQEEVAERLCARENTPEYGAITANVALRAEAKIVKRVSRDMFYPRPQVDSAVVRMDFCEGRISVHDPEMYRKVVRCAFLNRRKTLENNLINYFDVSRETAQEILQAAEIAPQARGETLSPERIAALSDVLSEMSMSGRICERQAGRLPKDRGRKKKLQKE